MLERFFRTTSVSLERGMRILMPTCGEENAVGLSAGSAPGCRRQAVRGAAPSDQVAGVLVVAGGWARRSPPTARSGPAHDQLDGAALRIGDPDGAHRAQDVPIEA